MMKLSRRTFLQGLMSVVGLPELDTAEAVQEAERIVADAPTRPNGDAIRIGDGYPPFHPQCRCWQIHEG